MDALSCLLSFITDKHFSIPLGEVFLFVVLIAVFLLLGKHKIGLLVTLCFVIYLGFFLNFDYLVEILGDTSVGIPLYIFFGVALVALVIVGYFIEPEYR